MNPAQIHRADKTISGVVCSISHGTARARNKKIANLLYDSVPALRDFELGTLNIQVTSPPKLQIKKINSPIQTVISIPKTSYSWRKRPLKAEKITLIPVIFSIPNKILNQAGFLYIPSRSSRPRIGILELMSPENLRLKQGVIDGDSILIQLKR